MTATATYTPTRPRDDRDDIVADLLGQRIRKCRELRGWTDRELARRAGITHATVGHVEAGRGGSLRTVTRMVFTLGCSWADVAPTEADVEAELQRWPWNPNAPRTR